MLLLCLFQFFNTKPRNWLGRTSPKWPILCRVGHKTLFRSIARGVNLAMRPFARLLWTLSFAVFPMLTRSLILLSTSLPVCLQNFCRHRLLVVFHGRRRNDSNRGRFSRSVVGRHSAGRASANDVLQWQNMSLEFARRPGSTAESFHGPRLSVVTNVGCGWYHKDLLHASFM